MVFTQQRLTDMMGCTTAQLNSPGKNSQDNTWHFYNSSSLGLGEAQENTQEVLPSWV